jgi:hypothetical protein
LDRFICSLFSVIAWLDLPLTGNPKLFFMIIAANYPVNMYVKFQCFEQDKLGAVILTFHMWCLMHSVCVYVYVWCFEPWNYPEKTSSCLVKIMSSHYSTQKWRENERHVKGMFLLLLILLFQNHFIHIFIFFLFSSRSHLFIHSLTRWLGCVQCLTRLSDNSRKTESKKKIISF